MPSGYVVVWHDTADGMVSTEVDPEGNIRVYDEADLGDCVIVHEVTDFIEVAARVDGTRIAVPVEKAGTILGPSWEL